MEKEAPRCPSCGARVFNRRYAKCEFCGEGLPDSVVFTTEERRALQLADEEEERARAAAMAEEKKRQAGDGFDGF